MAVKNMMTLEPVRYKTDRKGNKIPVYRAGIRDTNKHAKKTPSEIRHEENLGNKKYKPKDGLTPKTVSGRKVGRNEPCPCNSGKKFKKCHGSLV